MKSKKLDKLIYFLIFLSVIGLGIYCFTVRDVLTAEEVVFVPVETPKQMVVGIWDEFSANPILKRMIFTENKYQLLQKDGETPEQNTVIESGDYKISDDGLSIQLSTNGNETSYPLKIEASEGNPMTVIKIGEGSSYLYGLKASNQTDQMQMAKDLEAQQQGSQKSVTYLSPTGN